ncbi:helix-turn-helix domain-containing protein [Streptomyces sp. NPDC020794]|uniref:helix-turn-helix domain-containing protein n=1 Tax=unclassified Streptomyces TaxID=2593676 RepID=UPI0036EBB13B
MTDAPQGREAKFFALVLPALEEAGYNAYGHQQRLVADSGMNKSTVSRLLRREQIPSVKFFPALARVIGKDPAELLVAAEIVPPEYLESQQTLSETNQSRVGSERITPEAAADRLGFQDEVRRAVFLGVVESLKPKTAEDEQSDDTSGGAAARM